MDLDLVKILSQQYKDGTFNPETVLANACLEAYEKGFNDGIEAAEERMRRTHLLLAFTAGNA